MHPNQLSLTLMRVDEGFRYHVVIPSQSSSNLKQLLFSFDWSISYLYSILCFRKPEQYSIIRHVIYFKYGVRYSNVIIKRWPQFARLDNCSCCAVILSVK